MIMTVVLKVGIDRKWEPVMLQLLKQGIACNHIQEKVVFQE